MKFTIVTPSYNNAQNILQSIRSVYTQVGEFEIEHIVVDGASTDRSVDILKKHESDYINNHLEIGCSKYTFRYISEPDNGMYDAIVRGFSMATGDIYAWINTDDYYIDGAFEIATNVFSKHPKVQWIKGITNTIQKDGSIINGVYKEYNQMAIRKGVYGTIWYFIQQDSTFWRSELWKDINTNQLKEYKLAGDFRLWQLFSEQTPLYSINCPVSCFRKRDNQKSSSREEYLTESKQTVKYGMVENYIFSILYRIFKITGLNLLKGKNIKL